MGPNPHKIADLVTFTEKILNGKLHFLCSESKSNLNSKSVILIGEYLELARHQRKMTLHKLANSLLLSASLQKDTILKTKLGSKYSSKNFMAFHF